MAKRLNLRNRECPKCGGKIGVLKRATKDSNITMLGCVGGTHVQVQGTYGYSADDFPKKTKPLSAKIVNDYIATIRYPKFAAFAVNKLMVKFKLSREEAVTAWENAKFRPSFRKVK